MSELTIHDAVPLAPRTTLQLGGDARHLVTAEDDSTVLSALAWATARELPVAILGGGSNLVVADEGFDGLVIGMAQRGVEVQVQGAVARVTAQAGEPWDDVVACWWTRTVRVWSACRASRDPSERRRSRTSGPMDRSWPRSWTASG